MCCEGADSSSMIGYGGFHNGKPKPGSSLLVRKVRFENALPLIGSKAGAVIGDHKPQATFFPVMHGRNMNFFFLPWRVCFRVQRFGRIGKNIEQGTVQRVRIHGNARQIGWKR